jgi:hypothetical protein
MSCQLWLQILLCLGIMLLLLAQSEQGAKQGLLTHCGQWFDHGLTNSSWIDLTMMCMLLLLLLLL